MTFSLNGRSRPLANYRLQPVSNCFEKISDGDRVERPVEPVGKVQPQGREIEVAPVEVGVQVENKAKEIEGNIRQRNGNGQVFGNTYLDRHRHGRGFPDRAQLLVVLVGRVDALKI